MHGVVKGKSTDTRDQGHRHADTVFWFLGKGGNRGHLRPDDTTPTNQICHSATLLKDLHIGVRKAAQSGGTESQAQHLGG